MTGKEYIFYTYEGYTEPPNELMDVENLQVLGFAVGRDKSEAKQNLIAENPWIVECGFEPYDMICKQIFGNEHREDLEALLSAIDELRVHHPDIFQSELGVLTKSIAQLQELL